MSNGEPGQPGAPGQPGEKGGGAGGSGGAGGRGGGVAGDWLRLNSQSQPTIPERIFAFIGSCVAIFLLGVVAANGWQF